MEVKDRMPLAVPELETKEKGHMQNLVAQLDRSRQEAITVQPRLSVQTAPPIEGTTP
jgi:hypothetical protein